MSFTPPKTLAIDYGTKRVGTAINYLSLAQPLQILDNNEQLFTQLQQLCQEHQVKQLLVGVSEREMAQKTKEFAQLLQTKLDLPIVFWDENFSSVRVHHKLAQGPMKKSRRQQPIDHYAAAEFLQEWLDSN